MTDEPTAPSPAPDEDDVLGDAPTVPPPGVAPVDPARMDSEEEDVLEPGSTEVGSEPPHDETLTESQISMEEITEDDPYLKPAVEALVPVGAELPPSSDDMPALGESASDEVLLVETGSTRLPPALLQPVPGHREIVLKPASPKLEGTPMIHLEDIYKAFGKREILRGVEMAIYPGETVCIIGGSGTGKSVSLKHIMRLLEPDKGRIWLDGEDITEAHGDRLQAARSKLGVNFQFGALLNWLTVFENVALPLRENTKMKEPEIERRVMAKLELLKIPQARDLFPTQISGGMMKRAALARAVVMEETLKVILYDEPTSGLDPISTAMVDEMVNEMKARLGLTQVIVTHDMPSAYRTADRIAVLYEGKVVQFGTPEEIQNSDVAYVQQFIRGLSTKDALKQTKSGRFTKSGMLKALSREELEGGKSA